MDNESNPPYNTIMNTDVKISNEKTATHYNDVSLGNPYSDIQVVTHKIGCLLLFILCLLGTHFSRTPTRSLNFSPWPRYFHA